MSHLKFSLAALCLCLLSQAAFASPEMDRVDALVAEAIAYGSSPLSLAPVLEMAEYTGWLSDDEFDAVHTRLQAEDLHPATVTIVRYRQLRRLAGRGTFEAAAQLESDMGFLTRWALIGPFPNDGMSGFSAQLPPEIDGIFAGEVPGKVVPVSWRAYDRVSETGYLDVATLVAPAHDAVAYVATEFEVERSMDATLSVAIDGAYRIWLDGEPLAARDDHFGGFVLRDFVSARLARGRHTLLIKFAVDDDPMGLHARWLDDDGAPLVLTHAPASSLPASSLASDWPVPVSIADLIADEVAAEATPEDLAAAAYVVSSMHNHDPGQPWRSLAERATPNAASDLAFRRLAIAVDDTWRAEELLRQALPYGDPVTRAKWATLRLSQMGESGVEDATQVAHTLASAENPPILARVLDAMLKEYHGFELAAHAEWTALADEYPNAVSVLRYLLRSTRRLERNHELPDLLRRLFALSANAVDEVDDLAAFERARGDADAVEALIQRIETAQPLSPLAARQVAWVRLADQDIAGARQAADRAVALAPSSADGYLLRADVAFAASDESAAVSALAAALERQPQNQSVRDMYERLAPTGEQFFEPYRFEREEILALRSDAASDASHTMLLDQQVTQVYPNGLATEWVQQAYQVHTRSGADQLRTLYLGYTPGAERIEVRAVNVIKPDGHVVEVFDSQDFGAGSGPSSIYYDVHTRALSFVNLSAGDVLTYEYTVSEIAYQNLFDDYFGDMWMVQSSVPKRHVTYALHAPTDRTIYTSDAVVGGAWQSYEDGEETVRVFTAENVPAVQPEAGAPGPSETYAILSVSTYADWNTLGNWYYNLIREQLIEGPEIVATVESLIEGVPDRRDQIAAIYNYVVRNTRYVGLEFGIHGYKPYRTTDCFNRRFGDCKDTASLMKVMLNIAGIDAHLALVRTRDMGRIDTFPPSLSVFNHAITYVPEYDLFLDGTAGFSGSTELPTMDQGASTLIVRDGDGAEFRTISHHQAAESARALRLSVDLTSDVPTATGQVVFSGAFAPQMRTAYESAERRTERLEAELASTITGVRVLDATFAGIDDIETAVDIAFTLEGGAWVQQQGDEHVIASPVSTSYTQRYAGASERTLPLDIRHAFQTVTEFNVKVPDGWAAASPPISERVESPFGTFTLEVAVENGTLSAHYGVSIDRIRIAPEEYAAFRAYLQQVDDGLRWVARFSAAEEVTDAH